MSDAPEYPPLPPDTGKRQPVVARPESEGLAHVTLVGDVYTVLLSGEDTAGHTCLIEMRIPPGGGPAPHRHTFEETFTVLDGEIEVTVRGETYTVAAGSTAHVPGGAPHSFTNATDRPARLLCTCAPAGQEAFFEAVGVAVDGPELPAPTLTDDQTQAMMMRAGELAPRYQTELIKG